MTRSLLHSEYGEEVRLTLPSDGKILTRSSNLGMLELVEWTRVQDED